MMRFLRSAFVIARRDFAATVLSKAFIFFLLGPLFPLLLGGVFGGIGAQRREPDRAAGRRGGRLAGRFRTLVDGARPAGRRDAAMTRWSGWSTIAPEPISTAQQKRLLASRESAGARRADRRPRPPASDRRGRGRPATVGQLGC